MPVAVILTPIAAAFGLLARFEFSLPWRDDYWAILNFTLQYRRLPTVWSRLEFLIASQHVDYKLIFEHSLLVAQLALLGHIDFRSLILLGDLFLVGIAAAVWMMWLPEESDLRLRLLAFVPISFLLFSLNYSETLDWAMACLQNLPVIFFSMFGLYCLFSGAVWSSSCMRGALGRTRFGLAAIFAVLAALSSANGFLVLPMGAGLFALRREFLRCAAWCLMLPPLAAAYVYRYHVVLPAMHVPLYTKPLFVLAVLGETAPQRLTVLFGVLIAGVLMLAMRRRYFVDHPYAAAVSAWVVGTALMIAAGRGNYGLSASYAGRYKIYADLILIICGEFAARECMRSQVWSTRRRLIYLAAVTVSVLYCLRGDVAAASLLRQRRAEVETGITLWRQDPARNSPMYTSSPAIQAEDQLPQSGNQPSLDEQARQILNDAVATGLYTPAR